MEKRNLIVLSNTHHVMSCLGNLIHSLLPLAKHVIDSLKKRTSSSIFISFERNLVSVDVKDSHSIGVAVGSISSSSHFSFIFILIIIQEAQVDIIFEGSQATDWVTTKGVSTYALIRR